MKKEVKNIIIISIDDLRSDCIAANPHKELLRRYNLKGNLETPLLDWFIENGIFFSNCITSAPYTTTAHASILTGQWPYSNGIEDYFKCKLKSPTILKILKNEGFKTLFQSDFDKILGDLLGFTDGADIFVRGDDRKSLQWIKDNIDNKKACFFHFENVHAPFGFHGFSDDRINITKKTMFLLKKYNMSLELKIRRNGKIAPIKEYRIIRHNYNRVLAEMYERGLYGETMELYIEGINYFEKNRFNKFITGLKKLGLFDNSIFVIVGDHGEMRDESTYHRMGGPKAKNALFDEVVKVPWIIYGKDLDSNLIIDKQVRTIDIVPTMLSLMNHKKDEALFDGSDLSNFKKIPKNLDAYCQIQSIPSDVVDFIKMSAKNKKIETPNYERFIEQAAIRSGGYKLIKEYNSSGTPVAERLHDVTVGERRISIKKNNLIANKLRLKLERFNKKSGLYNNDEVDQEDKKKIMQELKSLGYNI